MIRYIVKYITIAMRNPLSILAVVVSIGISATLGSVQAASITVSAAVSLKESLTDATDRYAKQAGEKVELNFGASGHLLAQIREGAPVDVFIASASIQARR